MKTNKWLGKIRDEPAIIASLREPSFSNKQGINNQNILLRPTRAWFGVVRRIDNNDAWASLLRELERRVQYNSWETYHPYKKSRTHCSFWQWLQSFPAKLFFKEVTLNNDFYWAHAAAFYGRFQRQVNVPLDGQGDGNLSVVLLAVLT